MLGVSVSGEASTGSSTAEFGLAFPSGGRTAPTVAPSGTSPVPTRSADVPGGIEPPRGAGEGESSSAGSSSGSEDVREDVEGALAVVGRPGAVAGAPPLVEVSSRAAGDGGAVSPGVRSAGRGRVRDFSSATEMI
jgi:hypothetical protein